jgi:hypothetical protein
MFMLHYARNNEQDESPGQSQVDNVRSGGWVGIYGISKRLNIRADNLKPCDGGGATTSGCFLGPTRRTLTNQPLSTGQRTDVEVVPQCRSTLLRILLGTLREEGGWDFGYQVK